MIGSCVFRDSFHVATATATFATLTGSTSHHFPRFHGFTQNRALQSLILLSVPSTTMSRTEEECEGSATVTEPAVG